MPAPSAGKKPVKVKTKSSSATEDAIVNHPAMLKPLLHGANQQLVAKQYRRARIAYENVLTIDPACIAALRILCLTSLTWATSGGDVRLVQVD